MLSVAAVFFYRSASLRSISFSSSGKQEWVMNPYEPGPDLPTAGASLFDRLMTKVEGGKAVYDVPFPFPKLLEKIASHSKLQLGKSYEDVFNLILCPNCRSLQRDANRPEFFKSPRIVAGLHASASPDAKGVAIQAADRLYIGYQPKAEAIEVISYNDQMGRFEFQVIHDYNGGNAKVFYANRGLCIGCHQNHAPIFSVRPWSETNANVAVVAQLKAEGIDRDTPGYFHGVPLEFAKNGNTLSPSYLLDNSVGNANYYALLQRVWRDSCDDMGADQAAVERSLTCRRAGYQALLQYRLSNNKDYEWSAAFKRDFLEYSKANWARRGIVLMQPTKGVEDRDPFVAEVVGKPDTSHLKPDAQVAIGKLLANSLIAVSKEPSNLRPHEELYDFSDADQHEDFVGQRLFSLLSSQLMETDVRQLDEFLRTSSAQNGQVPVSHLKILCEILKYDPPSDGGKAFLNLRLKCDGPGAHVKLSISNAANNIKGTISEIKVSTAEVPCDGCDDIGDGLLKGVINSSASTWDVTFEAPKHLNTIRAFRLSNGNLLSEFRLSGTLAADNKITAQVDLQVVGDFLYFIEDRAMPTFFAKEKAKPGGGLVGGPFSREGLLRGLFAELKGKDVPDEIWPQARTEMDAILPDTSGDKTVGLFVKACVACHGKPSKDPPNFLFEPDKRKANIDACAEHIYMRMKKAEFKGLPKAIMPQGLKPETLPAWLGSAEYKDMIAYLEDKIKEHGFNPKEMLEVNQLDFAAKDKLSADKKRLLYESSNLKTCGSGTNH